MGKTFVTANLALALAREGRRVVAVDTDVEGANLHTWLGVPLPAVSLADFVSGRVSDAARLITATGIPELDLLAATHAPLATESPAAKQRSILLQSLRQLPCDFVLMDCGAGAHAATVDYFLAGEGGLLVFHPEPSSMENAYSFLRAALYRHMEQAVQKIEPRERVREAMDPRNEHGIRTPPQLLAVLRQMDAEDARRAEESLRQFRPRLVVNEIEGPDDVTLGFQVRKMCQSRFGIEADYIGYINRDDAVRDAIRRRKPLLDLHPDSAAATCLKRIARKLGESAPGGRPAAQPAQPARAALARQAAGEA